MTHPFDEHGEILRRALHAEADSVMPAPDGLERIRERIGDRHHRASIDGPGRRFGRAWFSQSWARPLLAAGAAAFIAVLAVSGPPAIHGITSAGDRGPETRGTPRQGSPGGDAPGGRQNPPYPGAQATPRPTAVVTATLSPVTGTPRCPVASPAVKARTSSARIAPGATPAPPVSASPACPKPSVTVAPTPSPSTPKVSQSATPSVPPQTESPPSQPVP